ncbi:BTB/POZ domain-containing protein KCTD6 [Patella vulgata]|uniref:BTB/POZ domain-containing protein KCTD6 n=1 Tax=Patella vulgata TaxID=6465 RepID=UPI00217FC03D|nr:BTB/POZ domain-containing protein KCTD6 [Patella vulgata]
MKMSDSITLNVGGVLYMTTKSTLCKYPDSMLGVLMSGTFPSIIDSNGHYFIDRDGTIFQHILNFLRSSHLSLPADFVNFDLLAIEADFYQIQPLLEAVNQMRQNKQAMPRKYHLEILEVRTGSTATMPTNNSRVKTVISGRKQVMLSLPADLIGAESLERLQNKNGPDFTELELFGSNTRLRLGEALDTRGWTLISSDHSSSSSYENNKSRTTPSSNNLIIEQSFRDRWCLELKSGEDIADMQFEAYE